MTGRGREDSPRGDTPAPATAPVYYDRATGPDTQPLPVIHEGHPMNRCDVCYQPGPTIHITDAITAITSHYHHDCYENGRGQ